MRSAVPEAARWRVFGWSHIEMDINNKLQSYRHKIQSATVFNKAFGDLVGIQLYDFIQGDVLLRTEVSRRVRYLDNLAADTAFNATQDRLFELISKILKEITPKQIEWVQVNIYRNARWVHFRGAPKDFVTLPQLYAMLLKRESYYRLGEDAPFLYMEGDILRAPPFVWIRKQNEIFEDFVAVMRSNQEVGNKFMTKSVSALLNGYHDTRETFDELIYAEPIKLHMADFITLFYFSMAVHQRKGHEEYYRFMHSSLYGDKHRPFELEEVQKACLQVIDDLSEIVSTEDPTQSNRVQICIDSQRGIFLKSTPSIAYGIDGERKKLVISLSKANSSMRLKTITKSHYSNDRTTTKAITDTNRLFKEKLGVKHDLIVHSDSSGYRLNREDYDIS